METSWKDSIVCSGFEAYRDIPEQLLGYRFVFQKLEFQRTHCRRILDYGCGPGKVALRLATLSNKEILAVDSSEGMLLIACKKRAHPLIEYQLTKNESLDLVMDNSIDAAMLCFVIINNPSRNRISKIIEEIYRVLKRGAPLVILDTNPDSTGIEFSTFKNGEPGRTYKEGEGREVRLYTGNNPDLILHDFHWPKSMYQALLKEAGFRRVELDEPTLRDIPKEELDVFEKSQGPCVWRGEWSYPPFVVFKAIK